MPRGRWVSHKGRSRHFTSPEELQRQKDEKSSEEEGSSSEEGEDGAAATSKSSKKDLSKRNRDKKMPTSSEESEEESDEEPARDSKKGVASLIEIENPNRVVKKLTNKVTNLKIDDPPVAPQLSRREREQIEQEQARLRYEKLHAEGKTDEAKADLERLAIIRQQRAEAAAKRLAEKAAQEQKKAANNKA